MKIRSTQTFTPPTNRQQSYDSFVRSAALFNVVKSDPSFPEFKSSQGHRRLLEHDFLVHPLAVAIASTFLLLGAHDISAEEWTDAWAGATFTLTTDAELSEIYFGKLPNNPIRGSGNPGAYLKGDPKGKILTVTVKGGTTNSGTPSNQVYLMGNFQAVTASPNDYSSLIVKEDNLDSILSSNYSQGHDGTTLNLMLEAGAKFYGVLYGGRNDLFGVEAIKDIGDSCDNSLLITLGKGASLGATLLFGGRSGQAEGLVPESTTPYLSSGVSMKEGYKTDRNKIIIIGAENEEGINLNFPAGGIFGAEGWQTNNNYVYLQNVNVSSKSVDSRKFGIVGGRGIYNFRIYNGERSGIANDNIVLIKDSKIAQDPESMGAGMSVLGAYSYGIAQNNIAVVENSVINGHVYGALELMGKAHLDDSDGKRRDLNANLVSLHNATLTGNSSIYGTATADGKTYKEENQKPPYWPNGGNQDENTVDQTSLKAVNRRRGIAYIGGKVQAASAFVRYIHFGQFVDSSKEKLVPGSSYNIVRPYYPTLDQQDQFDSSKPQIPIKYTEGNEKIRLGQLVAGSYIQNTKGFHSSLSQQDENQSNTTDGSHNFWVASYANLSGSISGDGVNLNAKVALFKNSSEVNHEYSEGELSLLALDDGMILGNTSSDLMTAFRDSYQGRVLYLGVNNGKDFDGNDIRAIAIDFKKIEDFRKVNKQNVNAYGNTQIGILVDGKGVGTDSQTPYSQSPTPDGEARTWKGMTFSVPNFEIFQAGEKVADATVGFYKYLHFDGQMTNDVEVPKFNGTEFINGKVSEIGKEGGVGIKYWLESLNLSGGLLILYGKTDDSTFADGRENSDTFTLSAYLTGKGGILIPNDTTVIIGDPRQPSLATNISLNGTPQEKIGENSFTGPTVLNNGAQLLQNTDGALGSEKLYTRQLTLEKGSDSYVTTYGLQGHSQTVGGLLVNERAWVKLNAPDKGGHLTVKGNASIEGNIEGNINSKLTINGGYAVIESDNPTFSGDLELIRSIGELSKQNALVNGRAVISAGSSLYFNSAQPAVIKDADERSAAYIRGIQNVGEVFLSGNTNKVSNLNRVNVSENYEGQEGSVIHYRGLVQGPENSYVDVVHSETATGTSKVSFGDDHSKIPVSGIFKEARGEKTLKSEGIPIFVIADKGIEGDQLRLEMQPFGVVAKDNEAYKWIYSLGYNDEEQGSQRTWVLYNSDDKDHYEPLVPPKEEENLVLRPEAGAYVGASQSWAKMHMRLHDRFGQAYYIDPFDGEEKPAAAWVRQVGSHSHFRMAGGQSKTHSNTAVTQIGGDLLRNEFNEDWKYIGGVFAGGLYNRSDSRSWDSAKSRSDGYSLGIYGTLYTGNSPDDGFYVDSWLLFGRYDNKIWSDEISPFKFKSHGWVWSVETGYTIPIGESGTKDYNKLIWTFQPEAQLVWDGVKANSANDSFGTKYRQLGTDNVTLRVGARLHANYMNKGLGFIEGNWIHNSKKAGVQMGTDKVYMDGGRNLGEFRMGLEGHLSRNTLGWATVGVQAGKAGYHNETAQIGIKYMF